MQLLNLTKPLEQMTEDELLEHVRKMRHNRTIARPAAKKHAERSQIRTERKASKKRTSSMDGLLAKLTEAEREALMKQLEGVGDRQMCAAEPRRHCRLT